MHRQDQITKNWKPFYTMMPLIDHNIWIDEVLKKHNIKQPLLYDYGFSHNNCNGRCVKAGQGHYLKLKQKMPEVFNKITEQEYHIKMCVSAYRYIIDKDLSEEGIIPEHIQEMMLAELDDCYHDYFYDRAPKPKLFIHPAASASCKYMSIKQYSFMKKDHKPYSIRDLNSDDNEESGQLDMFDIGGCGCFVDYNK